jgi:hypothetical protein
MSKVSTLLIFLLDGRRLQVLFAFLLYPLLGLLDYLVPLLVLGLGVPDYVLNLIVFDLYLNLDIVNVSSLTVLPSDLSQIQFWRQSLLRRSQLFTPKERGISRADINNAGVVTDRALLLEC